MKQKIYNLGMSRVKGSLPAEAAVAQVTQKLEEFGICIEQHVVATCTDGASTMQKFGRIIAPEHQLCLAHGLHLAVVDVLYKPHASGALVQANEMHACSESDDDDDHNEDEGVEAEHAEMQLRDDIMCVIKKVRKCVKMFRKSPTKNDILQCQIKAMIGREIVPQLDCPTRWNSLLSMIQTFLKIKEPLLQVLHETTDQIDFDESDIALIESIVLALEPVQMSVEALCRQDATLLTAEGIFKFLLHKLKQGNNTLSKAMNVSVKLRFSQWRNANLVGLLHYLQSPECLHQVATESVFAMPTKSALQKVARLLLVRLFGCESLENEETEEIIDMNGNVPLAQELENSIKMVTQPKTQRVDTVYKSLSKEMNAYEASGRRTENVDMLYHALNSVPPTSVESERAFSVAGNFTSKIRCQLEDSTLDALCFLKADFKCSN